MDHVRDVYKKTDIHEIGKAVKKSINPRKCKPSKFSCYSDAKGSCYLRIAFSLPNLAEGDLIDYQLLEFIQTG